MVQGKAYSSKELFIYLLFWWYYDLNSGACAAKQTLYHLSHVTSHFCFRKRVLSFAQGDLDYELPFYADMASTFHHA
jgi:hypothetical protein